MERSRRQGLGIWLLFYQVFGVIGLNNIPPTTLVFAALQVLIFLRMIPVPWQYSSDVCISVNSVVYRKQWKRLFYGALEHGNDWHLYYNMISFIWKGISLEKRFGSARFAFLISIFIALCSATLVGLNSIAADNLDKHYYHQCAVGFSGVLFSLKVLTTHYWPQNSGYVMGIPISVPVQYLVWVELLVIQVLVPNASLLGHLAGILVGLAYIYSPVGSFIDFIWRVIQSVLFQRPYQSNRFFSSNRLNSTYNNHRNYERNGTTGEERFHFGRQESKHSDHEKNTNQRFNDSPQPQPSAPYPDSDYSTTNPTAYSDRDKIRLIRLNKFK